MTTNLDLDALEALCHRANAEGNTFDDRLAFMDEACAAIPELLRMARENRQLKIDVDDHLANRLDAYEQLEDAAAELTALRAANLAAQKLIDEDAK